MIAVVGTVVLVGSVGFLLFLGNLADLVPSGAAGLPTSGGGKIRKEVLLDGTLGSEREIAVIDVRGMILYDAPFDGASARSICGQLKAAKEDESVVGVILDMNTPGGEVTASDEIHRAVLKLRETGKPVVTCMHAMGASGGYFIAAGTDCIVANRLTLTGSIGVLIGTLNYAGLFEKIGLESEVYKSGKMKDLLAGGRTRTEAEKALVNELVTSNFHAFAQVVADGRERYRSRADVLAAEFADGRVLSGEQALASGLVDQLGYFEDAVAKARELADASGAKVVRLRRALRFSDLLMSMKAPQVGALRNFLPQEIRSLQPGRYYYLTPTVLE
ncbi:MAG: signal peptide peptidase SppA [Lentisphaerae bacterium]|nr:signal peptide peptidase SppA [Lentisphaerota bacterium]MBT4823128.1 signal peptide peptidase SppA [Lentisphaerota bacterium]MBT5610483.1 signal peptide peptidase SppA [Lentisphaerota bacterium]MBT7061074.1 signal peptide peptidase SppA [Lentisphaerota bacterium]MBT7843569.1 signal peptide peptidase SppA [Lentisphaerota bacterium]